MDESVHGRSAFSRLQCEERKVGAQLDQLIGRAKTVSGDTPDLVLEVETTNQGDHNAGS